MIESGSFKVVSRPTRIRRFALLAFLVFLFMVVPATPALAYIDPATTTYIIQVITALIVTLGVSLSIFLYRFQMVTTNIRVYLHAFFRRWNKQKAEQEGDDSSTGSLDSTQTLLSEEDALAAGVIDFAIPVSASYPALALCTLDITNIEKKETVADKPANKGLLHCLGHWLWDDKRSFKNRLLKAILISAAIAITYGLFNMLDLLITNKTQFIFTFADAIGPILIFVLIMFSVLVLILIGVKGRVFDFGICLLLSFLICGYLQNTFFNTGIGELMGQILSWDVFGTQAVLINLSLWIAVFIIIFTLGFIHRSRIQQIFKGLFYFIPALLILVQVVALFSILPPMDEWQGSRKTASVLALSKEDIYKVSSEKNVIVLIVDTMDEDYVNLLTDEDPHFFDNLDGFTRFTNCVTVYSKTYPSMVNFFTDVPYDTSVPYEVYMENSYAHRSFVNDIRDQGYISNLYIEKPHTYVDEKQLEGLADNLDDSEFYLKKWKIPLQLFRLSLLKDAPLALKYVDWLYPDFSFWGMGTWTSGSIPYWSDDPLFYSELKDQGLTTTEGSHFILIHMNGFHLPFTMNSQAEFVGEGVSPIEQYKGSLFIVNEYLNQLKELGLYKDATIIIMGDHAEHTGHKNIDRPMLVGCFVKPSGEEGTPLRYSNAPVSIKCLRATCVEATGGDPTPWGKTFFEVGEDEVIERYYYHRFTDEKNNHYMSCYRIVGDANNWENWELIDMILVDSKNWW